MTQLATLEQANGALVPPSKGQSIAPLMLSYQQLWEFAATVSESGMFPGIDKPAKAMALMMLCQAEGLHPVLALKRYHIIEGRPSLKAQTLDAEFLARGGQRRILRCDAVEARAVFSHPKLHPDPVELFITWEECKDTYAKDKNGGIKKNWLNSRPDMLWSRLVARGARRVDPGIETGIPTCEELDDVLSWEQSPAAVQVDLVSPPKQPPQAHAGPLPPAAGDVPVPGGPADRTFDPRPFFHVIQKACDVAKIDFADGLSTLRNRAVQLGLWDKAVPVKRSLIISMLDSVYRSDRDWMRTEIAALAAAKVEATPPPKDEPKPAPAPSNGSPFKSGEKLYEWAKSVRDEDGINLLVHLSSWGAGQGYPVRIKQWNAEQADRGWEEGRLQLERLAMANGVPV